MDWVPFMISTQSQSAIFASARTTRIILPQGSSSLKEKRYTKNSSVKRTEVLPYM